MKEIVTQHIRDLGLRSVRQYHDWCLHHGFSTGVNKGKYRLQAEIEHAKNANFLAILGESNKPKGFKYYLNLLRNGEKITSPPWLTDDYQTLKHLDKALADLSLELLEYLDDESRLTEIPTVAEQRQNGNGFFRAIMALVAVKDLWIRDYKTWKPKSHNADRQFASFVRHLLVKYDMPLFMDRAWLNGTILDTSPFQDWYIHIGLGGNLRTAKRLPYPITKMEAHYFMQAPESYTIPEALRYGQLLSLGGSPRLAQAMRGTQIMPTNLLTDMAGNDFCLSVIRFFIANPMLDMAHIHPITDYIWNQKYQCGREFVNHVAVNRPPPQPNFSMHGRTPESLLDQVERWHHQLGKERKGGKLLWEHSTVKDFELQEGQGKNARIWRIAELLSSAELTAEGRTMHHCVASYAGSCAAGRSSIWALTLESEKGLFKYLTIEVSNKQIRQVRGLNNRNSTQQENTVLNKWAQVEGLGRSTYS